MPSTPIMRAACLPVLCLISAAQPVSAAVAEPIHPNHAHAASAKPTPAPPPKPSGPLQTPAPQRADAASTLVEAVAHAGQRLVAVGADGAILLSDDNGLSWRATDDPASATLTGIAFVDDTIGWAIGHYGVVLRTEDAGESWNIVLDAPRAARITMDAAQSLNGSDQARTKAIDAARQLSDADPARPFQLLQTDGAETLRVIGTDGMAMETQDAGKHWHAWSNALDDPGNVPLLGIARRDGVAVAVGAKGTLIAGRPEEGLTKLKSPTDATLFGALDADRFGVLVFGQQGNAFVGTLAQPVNQTRADAWKAVESPTQNSFTAGFVRRDGTVLLGDSAGMVWTLSGKPDEPRLDPSPQRAPFPILAIAEAQDGALVLAGTGGLRRIEPPAANPPQPAPPAPPSLPPSPAPDQNKPTAPAAQAAQPKGPSPRGP